MKRLLTFLLLLIVSNIGYSQGVKGQLIESAKYDFVEEKYIIEPIYSTDIEYLVTVYEEIDLKLVFIITYYDGYNYLQNDYMIKNIIHESESYTQYYLTDIFSNNIYIEDRDSEFIIYFNESNLPISNNVKYKNYFKGIKKLNLKN
jgi:hypothetical protein